MKSLIPIILKPFPQWDKEIITEIELQQYCDSEGALVVDHPTEHLGEYSIINRIPCIWLEPTLSAPARHVVFTHESGHLLLRHPFPQKFNLPENQKNIFESKLDHQANFFASIALMPLKMIKKKTPFEIYEEYGYFPEMIELRFEFFRRYKR